MTAPGNSLRLAGVGVADHTVAALRSCGLGPVFSEVASAAAGEAVGGAGVVVLTNGHQALQDDACWSPVCRGWIDVSGMTDGAVTAAAARSQQFDLYCSFGTAVAAALPLASRIMAVISRKYAVSDECSQDIELALHEAISNALVHGNLGVSSMGELSISALDTYSQRISESLEDPSRAGRRLEVSAMFEPGAVVISVEDEGAGYQAPTVCEPGASGRGLDLITAIAEKCDISDGGRRITMRFAL